MDFLSADKDRNMHKQFAKLLSVLVLAFSLLMSQVGFIQAQSLTPTLPPTLIPTLAPTAATTQTTIAAVTDPNAVTFTMLRQNEIQLVGPYDSIGFSFSIPADWKLTAGTQLEVSMGVSFNTVIQNQADAVFTSGGLLTVLIDDQVLGVIPLNQNGESNISIPIPPDRLVSQNTDQSMTISFILNSGISCNLDQHTNVFIHPNSRFILPHASIKPDTSLVNFPYPLYQNLVITDSALLVVADKPTTAEMKAALTVSAGLSNLSGNSLLLDLTTVSKLTADQQKANHIILVGKAASLATLKQLNLPMPVTNNQFQITGGNPDDGVIQMINSPWSDARLILVVSGNSDVGTVKAAQAIGTGVIRPNRALNLAVIDRVETTAASVSQADDRTLAEMGYENAVFQKRGTNYARYTFIIPPGFTLASDAYFDLVYGNSALLDYNRSGIVAQLNGRPIGSVRLNDVSAGFPMNRSRIHIPSAAVIPGRNVLQIVTTLWPTDDCTPPGINQGLWVNIWPESLLHLPLSAALVNPAFAQENLSSYLPSFLSNPFLSDTAFVLPGNNLEAWRSGVQIAAYLGDQANSPIIDLSVFYADAVPAAERSKYNFFVIGRPSEMPIMREMNSSLPVPFLENSDISANTNFQVTYRIPPETPMGYVQIMPSLWNSNNVILAVLGNTTEGVSWATAALTNSDLSWRLAGNFAAVNNHQILTTDTRMLVVGSGIVATQASNETVLPPAVGTTVPVQMPATQSDWILPVLGVTVALIVLILVIVLIGSWLRNRTRSKKG